MDVFDELARAYRRVDAILPDINGRFPDEISHYLFERIDWGAGRNLACVFLVLRSHYTAELLAGAVAHADRLFAGRPPRPFVSTVPSPPPCQRPSLKLVD